MIKPKFAEGERVTVRSSPQNLGVRPGVYVIVRVLPTDSQGGSYRAKSVMDSYERVFLEGELSKA